MPKELVDDAIDWLRARGSPITTKNLNAAQAHLAENPDQRPSYAEQYASGEYTAPDVTADAPDLDAMLDAAEGTVVSAPARTKNKPQTQLQPQTLPSSSALPADDVGMSDSETDVAVPSFGAPDVGVDVDVGNNSSEPKLAPAAGLDSAPMSAFTGEPDTNASPAQSSNMPSAGTATAVGAGVGAAAHLAAELKHAMDSGMEDNRIREHFSKNISSRVANATRGSSASGALPKGVRPELQPHQLSALTGAVQAIREGNMAAAEKWLTFLSPEDQTALRSTISRPPAAALNAPTGAQRMMTSQPVQTLIQALSKTLGRGR